MRLAVLHQGGIWVRSRTLSLVYQGNPDKMTLFGHCAVLRVHGHMTPDAYIGYQCCILTTGYQLHQHSAIDPRPCLPFRSFQTYYIPQHQVWELDPQQGSIQRCRCNIQNVTLLAIKNAKNQAFEAFDNTIYVETRKHDFNMQIEACRIG